MATAWRNGVVAGFLLFFFALISALPYLDSSLGVGGIMFLTDASTVISAIIYLEAGRRTGHDTGMAGYAAVTGGVAGFLAALSGLPVHAILATSSSYAAYLTQQVGSDAHLLGSGGMAVAMAGVLASVVVSVVVGAVLGVAAGVFGAWTRRRALRVGGEGA